MYKIIIFDMDGTVLDTLEDLTDSINAVIPKYGFNTKTVDEIRSFVGNGLTVLLKKATENKLNNEKLSEISKEFAQYYDTHCMIKTRPYAGIINTVKELKKAGYITALVSNKRDSAVQILCRKMFPDCFDFALGEKAGIERKPSAEPIDFVLNKYSLKASDAVYIGDSEVDIKTALNSGTDIICVTWGFRDEDFLRENGCRKFAGCPEQLLNIIKGGNVHE